MSATVEPHRRRRKKAILRAAGPSFTNWMRAIVEEIPDRDEVPFAPPGDEISKRMQIRALVEALADLGVTTSINTIYGYLEGKGASPYRVWLLGEALRSAGIRWMSGATALSAVLEYRWHFLGWLGTLVSRTGPTQEIRQMWPMLTQIACDHYAAWPQHKRGYLLPYAAAWGWKYPVEQKFQSSLLMLDEPQITLFNEMWSAWSKTRQETNQFPAMIRLEMRLDHFESAGIHYELARSLISHFFAEWMTDAGQNWEKLSRRFELPDEFIPQINV